MKTKCPLCNYIATEYETLDHETDFQNGDISLCINCGNFNQFKNNKLVECNIMAFDLKTRKELKRIRDAWVRTQAMARLQK